MNYEQLTVIRDADDDSVIQILKGVLLNHPSGDILYITNYNSSRKEENREMVTAYDIYKRNVDVIDTLKCSIVRTFLVRKVGKEFPTRVIKYSFPR